jgi:hypothetical protein
MTDRQMLGRYELVGVAIATRMRRLRWRATLNVTLLSLCVVACSTDDKKKVLADGCVLNSDCSSGLVCSFSRCHTPCVVSKDCPTGASCVKTGDGNAVCQLPEEASCDNDSGCPKPLVCGVDQNCRGTCKSQADCPSGQKCSNQQLCAEPSQVDANNDLFPKGGGGASGTGGSGGGTLNNAGASNVGGITSGGSTNIGGNAGAGAPNVGGTTPGGSTSTSAGGSSNGGTTSAGGSNAGAAANAGASANGGTNFGGSANGGTFTNGGTTAGGSVGLGGTSNAGGSMSIGGSNNGGNAGVPGTGGVVNCTGQAPSYFGHVATSNSNPNYTSGVGVRTATDFVIFNGFVGDIASGAAGAAGVAGVAGAAGTGGVVTKVNRIDVQHFNPSTGASKGDPAPLLVAAGDGSGLYINGAAIAPTGEVAIIYSAATTPASSSLWGTYLAFLDKDLAFKQTTQIAALGLDQYRDQSYVQWLNGKFVASTVVAATNPPTIKLAKFGADGANAGSTSAIPTENPSGSVSNYNQGEGEVAFSGNLFAVAYVHFWDQVPYLTILDAMGVGVTPIKLPSSEQSFVSVAGTSQGFIALYNGAVPGGAASVLATFVSNASSGAAGAGGAGSGAAGAAGAAGAGALPTIGATYAFPGGRAYRYQEPYGPRAARGSSDGIGAGFAVLYPEGSVSFLYFSGDGSTHASPQTALQQSNTASAGDIPHISTYAGSFAVSLYSGAEHLTRMVASSCQ